MGEASLNADQRAVFERILAARAESDNEARVFFLNAPGGTGKTHVNNLLCAKIRGDGGIVLAVASCGLAVLLMPGGQTAHSSFKLPVQYDDSSTCNIEYQSELAELIRRADLVITWEPHPR